MRRGYARIKEERGEEEKRRGGKWNREERKGNGSGENGCAPSFSSWIRHCVLLCSVHNKTSTRQKPERT